MTALVALLLGAGALRAEDFHVALSNNNFTPRNLTIHQGDTVIWTNNGGHHNVHADNDSFRCSVNCTDDNDPSTALWTASHSFLSLGPTRYYCDQHGGINGVGMSGTITVLPIPEQLLFSPLPPCRIVDTRPANGGTGALAPGETRSFKVVGINTDYTPQGGQAGSCGMQEFMVVRAAFVNLVAISPSGPGNLKAYAGDGVLPAASTLNYAKLTPNLNIANGISVPVRTSGPPTAGNDITITNSSFASVDVVIDVVGFFAQNFP